MGKTIPVSADIWEAGTHLISPRGLYTHHGIYIGNGQVIHYSGLANGLNDNGTPGIICQVSLKEFEKGNPSHARSYSEAERLPSESIVQRAKSRLGESRYSIVLNNCEHFASWCVTGRHNSRQISRIIEAVAPEYADTVNTAINLMGAVRHSSGLEQTFKTLFDISLNKR